MLHDIDGLSEESVTIMSEQKGRLTSADAFDVLYDWAKNMYANAQERFETTKDIPTIQLETGTMGAYRAVISVLERHKAEGFTDAEALAKLRETNQRQLDLLTRQSELIDKLQGNTVKKVYSDSRGRMQKQIEDLLALVEQQRQSIETQQGVIAKYEAMFDSGAGNQPVQ